MKNMIDNRIVQFINKHHVLTIATSHNNIPWTANCFYVFVEHDASLVFTSDINTRHGKELVENPVVAGSVVLESSIVGKIRGVQFTGYISKPEHEYYKKLKKIYLKKFPVAALMNTNLWAVKLSYIKFTDNRLGFGKKLIWNR